MEHCRVSMYCRGAVYGLCLISQVFTLLWSALVTRTDCSVKERHRSHSSNSANLFVTRLHLQTHFLQDSILVLFSSSNCFFFCRSTGYSGDFFFVSAFRPACWAPKWATSKRIRTLSVVSIFGLCCLLACIWQWLTQ